MSRGFPAGFQWDEGKNRANIDKHGIDFWDAVRAFGKPTFDRVDDRRGYGEKRVNSVDEFDGQVVVNMAHTDRDGETLCFPRSGPPAERERYLEFVRGTRSHERG